MSEPQFRPTYKSLNKPLTILGVERRLFFSALILGAATFSYFSSLAGGVAMFVLLYFVARHLTATDPQLPRIVINASRFRVQYDAGKREVYDVKVVRRG